MKPLRMTYRRRSAELELEYADQRQYRLSCEFLRVHSPSAEVRGHTGSPAAVVHGKQSVRLLKIEPVGHYAVQLYFDDGHHSGLYDWPYLLTLCEQQPVLWQQYLQRLQQAGLTRQSSRIQSVPKP